MYVKETEEIMFIVILKYIIAGLTIATGLYALIVPKGIEGFTGLVPANSRGVTEIRAVMGGVFIALGAAVIYFNQAATYQMLGIMYLVIAIVRTIFMFVDKSLIASNFISLAVEIVFGILLFL
jgi:hypothetical protein